MVADAPATSKVKNKLLAMTAHIIPYVKALKPVLGNTNAVILMQQLEYWFNIEYKRGKREFYKFLAPSPNSKSYHKGDSWAEELALTEKEFRTAFDCVGVRYASVKEKNASEDLFQGMLYCSYVDRIKGLTFYLRNDELVELVVDFVTFNDFDDICAVTRSIKKELRAKGIANYDDPKLVLEHLTNGHLRKLPSVISVNSQQAVTETPISKLLSSETSDGYAIQPSSETTTETTSKKEEQQPNSLSESFSSSEEISSDSGAKSKSKKPKKNKLTRIITIEQEQLIKDTYNKYKPAKMRPMEGCSIFKEPLIVSYYNKLCTVLKNEYNGDFDLYIDSLQKALTALKFSDDFHSTVTWDFSEFSSNAKTSAWASSYNAVMKDFEARKKTMSVSEIRDIDPKDFDRKYSLKLGGYPKDGKYWIIYLNPQTQQREELEWFSPEVCQKVQAYKDVAPKLNPRDYEVSPRFFRVVYWESQGKCKVTGFADTDIPMYTSTDGTFWRDELYVLRTEWFTLAKKVWEVKR